MTVATVPFVDIDAADFDFADPDMARARERHWYADTRLGPMILRYAEAVSVLADRRLSPTGRGHLDLHGIRSGPIHDYFSVNLSSRERAEHAMLRSVVAPFLSRRKLRPVREFAARRSAELVEQLRTSEPVDFMSAFADPLAVETYCVATGLPIEDRDQFGRWSADVGLVFSLSLDGVRERAEEALAGLTDYFTDLMRRRREQPGDDLVSAMEATRARHGISERQCRSILISLVMGGHDAPMHQLGCAVATLAAHPEQWRLLGERPDLADRATEEALRWSSHTHTLRFAVRDTELDDLHLPKGAVVIPANTVANRDPRAFDRPDVFDITARRSKAPIAFGGGPYFCPGNGLAKVEIAAALTALTGALPPPEVGGKARWRAKTATAHGPETLPLLFA